MTVLWIALGGALGSLARYYLTEAIALVAGNAFPWGTLLVNVSGSFVIGVVAGGGGEHGRWIESAVARQFLMVGVCGGYTTFSAFSLQTLNLLRDREWLYAAGNMLLSVSLCLVAVWLGYIIGSAFSSPKGN